MGGKFDIGDLEVRTILFTDGSIELRAYHQGTEYVPYEKWKERFPDHQSVDSYFGGAITEPSEFGTLVGYLVAEKTGEVGRIYVHPLLRRKGIASHLNRLAAKKLGERTYPGESLSEDGERLYKSLRY